MRQLSSQAHELSKVLCNVESAADSMVAGGNERNVGSADDYGEVTTTVQAVDLPLELKQ